jgi:transposase
MDVGDKNFDCAVLDEGGRKIGKRSFPTTQRGVDEMLKRYRRKDMLVVLETGTHSPWISALIESRDREALVANAREASRFWQGNRKTDETDAEILARVGRFDPGMLKPIRHRGREAQAHLALIKSREALVENRTSLVNHARGLVKSVGGRIRTCSASAFGKKALEDIPEILTPALVPVVEEIRGVTERIRSYDRRVKELCRERYPETSKLTQVTGVGPLTALCFVLKLESPERFRSPRTIGAYLGMTPRKYQSGEMDKQLPISKKGDRYLRQLLVNCAHYILGPFGPDCDLRRFGERLTQRGGRCAKKKAVVAVARKLSILLYRLWRSEILYDPLYNRRKKKPLTA